MNFRVVLMPLFLFSFMHLLQKPIQDNFSLHSMGVEIMGGG